MITESIKKRINSDCITVVNALIFMGAFGGIMQAQTTHIADTIIDADSEESLVGISVYINQLKGEDATDSNDISILDRLTANSYEPTVLYIGYHTKIDKITLRHGGTSKLTANCITSKSKINA